MVFSQVITHRGTKSVYIHYCITDGEHCMLNSELIKREILEENFDVVSAIGAEVIITGCSEITEEDYESLTSK